PACGAANDPDDRFCGECGAALEGEPRPVAAEAERRLVSVLFGDLVGFTPLSADRDPEGVRELLSHYFETARRVMARYGGTVERFIGDAIASEHAGAHELNGKSEPVPRWRAARVSASRRGEGRATGLEAPFVGRERELRLIKDLFHAASEERRARLVSIIGVAGIGKTR